jgi:hypothetical protein
MKKISILIVLLLFIAASANAQMQGSGESRLKIILMKDVYVNESSKLLVQALDPMWNFMPGAQNDIMISIWQNNTYVLRNAQPHEVSFSGESYYECNFKVNKTGQWIVYVSYQNMVAVDLFVSKFNVSQNLTEQQQHVETIMGSEHNERMSMVSQIIGQMSSLDTTYQNMSQHQERFSWTETLNKQLSDSAMQVLFYCLVFMAIFIIFSLIYTNQRERVFERISGLPQQVAAGVEKEVEKRKAYQR